MSMPSDTPTQAARARVARAPDDCRLRRRRRVFLLASLLAATAATAAPGFRIETLAPDVYAAIRTDPPGLMVDANCVFIVNQDDVVVVDAPEASDELIAALKRITDKPVRYLINTHWHDDHIIGNARWRSAYPAIQFVAHPSLREYLPGTGAANRAQMIAGAPAAAAQMQAQLDLGKNLAGAPISEEEKTSYASDIALVAHYMQVVPGTPIVLPDLEARSDLILQSGNRRIEIRPMGRGHTAADLIVWLPQERVLVTGDLVVWPVPLVGAEQSYVGDWSATLDTLMALQPVAFVPGHGPVLHDDSYVRRLSALFSAITTQVKQARAQGLDLKATRARITLDEWRQQFAGESGVRQMSFRMYVNGPAIESAWRALD